MKLSLEKIGLIVGSIAGAIAGGVAIYKKTSNNRDYSFDAIPNHSAIQEEIHRKEMSGEKLTNTEQNYLANRR